MVKHLGQTRERKSALTMSLRIVTTKSVKTLRMNRLRRRVLLRAQSRGGASKNTPLARFLKSCFARICKCKIHVFSQA